MSKFPRSQSSWASSPLAGWEQQEGAAAYCTPAAGPGLLTVTKCALWRLKPWEYRDQRMTVTRCTGWKWGISQTHPHTHIQQSPTIAQVLGALACKHAGTNPAFTMAGKRSCTQTTYNTTAWVNNKSYWQPQGSHLEKKSSFRFRSLAVCHQSFSARCRCVFVGRCVNAANVNSLYSASGTKTSERYMFLYWILDRSVNV